MLFASAARQIARRARFFSTRITTLPNGLRVATETNASPTVALGVFVNTGSIYETEKNNGVAHFLEHMAFKGTARRSQQALELEVENMGASLNAYTSREQTVFSASLLKDKLAQGVDLLADILQHSTLSEEHIERERSVILTEMREVLKIPEEVVFDHLHSSAFQGTSLGYPILGPASNVRSITRADLQEYIRTHYTADRMVVAAVGGVNHDELVRLAEKHFDSLQPKSSIEASQPFVFTGGSVQHQDETMKDVHIALAVEGASWSSPDYPALMVIQNIVGNWDRSFGTGKNASSRLCEVIATEQLAHSLRSFNTCYHDGGLFGAHIVAPPNAAEDVVCEVISEWVRLANRVTAVEVERAKAKLKTSIVMALDGNVALCDELGRQMLALGRRVPTAELFKRIDDVDLRVVRRVSEQYFHDTCPAAVGLGELFQFPDYNQLRGWTYWNRL